MQVTDHAPGTFCWAELQTSDSSSAKAFYGALLGWSYSDTPIGPNTVYSTANVGGHIVGALYSDPSGKRPTAWSTYIRVKSADDFAASARSNGAMVIAGPFDVTTVGRMAVIQDPTGAIFHVWEPRANPGYNLVGEPGSVCWNELNTRDTSAAETFYTAVFGYGIKHSDMSGPYTEFQVNGKSIAGMTAIETGSPNAPHWQVIFTVANCELAVDVAKELGGRLLLGPTAVPGVGNYAMLADPQGAIFGVVD